jgi:hypothetical protein
MPEDKHVFTLRLDPGLVKRIDEMNARRFFVAGGKGKPPMLNRSETIRWLLGLGLDDVERDLDRREAKLKRSR